MIHQELHLVGAQTVAENIFLGRGGGEALRRDRLASAVREASEAFARLEIEIDVTKPVDEASTWERGLVEIARALGRDAGC